METDYDDTQSIKQGNNSFSNLNQKAVVVGSLNRANIDPYLKVQSLNKTGNFLN